MNKLKRILCFFGIHKWSQWYKLHEDRDGKYIFAHLCQRCHQILMKSAQMGEDQ